MIFPQQVVRTVSGEIFQFEIDDFRKRCLLEGLDEIGLTLGKAETIKGYEPEAHGSPSLGVWSD